ncbi:cytochrome P450 [Streptomyces sp. NPDC101062]|uniref:TmcI n=1 Tax=Streptomyces chromofuscus TaxID=42881 RepID=A0A1L7SAS9_STRCW|nr:cytochrome P450 [Streptomyces sp. JV176]MEE1800982.1 cytochrome P450 [Streptomyces sp. JV176]CUX96956.1 TmcI [Streptomyces chromofuscus]
MVTIDPNTFNTDPFPLLHRLREEAPVHQVEVLDGLGRPRWLITRYEDALKALNDLRFSNELFAGMGPADDAGEAEPSLVAQAIKKAEAVQGRAMANLDPPDHTRLRKLVVRSFSAKRMEALRPQVQEVTDALLDTVAGQDEFDLLETLAYPLSIRMVCTLLGVPADGVDVFRGAAAVLAGFMNDDDWARETLRSLEGFDVYVRQLVADKRDDPRDDMLSDLIHSTEEGGRLTEEELVAMAGLMIFAGHETTVQLITNAVLALHQNPRQMAALRADHGLLSAMTDEVMRYDGPINPGINRVAREDIEIGGVTIPKGASVVIATAAANRDPRAFTDPDRFDITRSPDTVHLGFGHGIHYCLGARLAKIEAECAIGTLLRRYPRIALATEPENLRWRPGFLRMAEEFRIRVDAPSPPADVPAHSPHRAGENAHV